MDLAERQKRYVINFEAENSKKADRIRMLKAVLAQCRTVLGNMAAENENDNRWPINHEPLRADAKALLPYIDAALSE